MAVRDQVKEPAASRRWEKRIAERQADLIHTADDWASLLPAVQRSKKEIARCWSRKKKSPALGRPPPRRII
jgi:hypothetical protein